MVKWQLVPQQQVVVTHAAVNYTIDASQVVVRRHENGFDTGTATLEDTEAKNYVDKVAVDDIIEIKQKDTHDAAWTTILKGVIRRVNPILPPNTLQVECDGAGYGLGLTVCGEEYGTESDHPTLDTIREILKDATDGVIPIWANKVLGSALVSGYSYTTYIEDIAGTVPYLYFPYKPCSKTINDVCDVLQAIKGTNAGPHWIVDTSSHFLLTTIGAHSAAGDNPAQFWPTWWRTDQAGSTLTEGNDFLNFRFQHLGKQANYVLYHGRFKKPANGDTYTNNNSGDWGGGAVADENGAGLFKVGTHSIKFTCPQNNPEQWYYPDVAGTELAWDIGNIGGIHNIPTVNFWCMRDGNEAAGYPHISMTSYAAAAWTGHWYYELGSKMTNPNEWYYFSIPIGAHAQPTYMSGFRDWYPDGVLGGNWAEIDCIRFRNAETANVADAVCWIDGLNVTGWVLRGARQAAVYTAAAPLKLKVITDEVGKDDSLVAADDTGLMGRLAYAEYLRVSSTPIVGTITIPMANDLLPGQQIHLQAKKESDGTFRIGKDFRAIRVVHSISEQGFLTFVDVTDDLKNANPRPLPTQLNVLLGAVRPEYQDRQASSIKAREIDITQPILEKSY